jgi:23S rRNA pseudouridine1911/1915/1917 synthase
VADERWEVPAALAGERLDRALAVITGLTRARVNEIVDAGQVRIGARVVTSRSRRVRAGETLVVAGPISPAEKPAIEGDPLVSVPVVYADEALLVVDKPAGMVVHPGAGNPRATMVQGLLARYPDLGTLAVGDQMDRPGVVHRLDKGTSGLLVVARTAEARARLTRQLTDRTMGREYETLVTGRVEADEGLIDAPLARSDLDPTRIRVQSGGRPARTRYRVVERFAEPAPTTLLRCRLETGRTHQIRVHLSSIGHPVVADDRYGTAAGQGPLGSLTASLGKGRPFLHAAVLEFDHPASSERLRFISQLPEDLLSVLAGIADGH